MKMGGWSHKASFVVQFAPFWAGPGVGDWRILSLEKCFFSQVHVEVQSDHDIWASRGCSPGGTMYSCILRYIIVFP